MLVSRDDITRSGDRPPCTLPASRSCAPVGVRRHTEAVSASTSASADVAGLIPRFVDQYEFLSNFAESPLRWQGRDYRWAESAFHAGKTLDEDLRERIAAAPSPKQAKALGRALKLRPDWKVFWRHAVMREVLAEKFRDPDLASKLIATGTALLIEGNYHHDNDWGDCR